MTAFFWHVRAELKTESRLLISLLLCADVHETKRRKFHKVKRMLLQAVLIVEGMQANDLCGSKPNTLFSQVFM